MKDTLAIGQDSPDVGELKTELQRSIVDVRDLSYMDDVRLARWPGQTTDGRKHSESLPEGKTAFPFEGASDTRVLLADEIIRQLTNLLVGSHQRASLRVSGVETTDMTKAGAASTVVNWAKQRIYNQLGREATLLANYQENYGYALAMVSWDQQLSMREQKLTMREIIALADNADDGSSMQLLPQMIEDPGSVDTVVEMFKSQFPTLKKRDLRGMIKELRETGETSFPVPYVCRNQPCITALKPHEDFLLPPETIDIQSARVIFRRQFLTEAEIRSKIVSEDWDEEFVEEAIKTKGHSGSIDHEFFEMSNFIDRRDNLIEVWWAYYRSVNPETNIPAIHYCIFSNVVRDELFAKSDMLPYAHNEYPFIEFKAEEFARRAMDSRSVCEVVKTWQDEIKVQRDGIRDYTSLTTLPPLQVVKRNGPVNELGPATQVPVTRVGDVQWMTPPAREPATAFKVEVTIRKQCAEYFGLHHPEVPQPTTTMAQQQKVGSWLRNWTEVYRQMFRLCIQFLELEELQRITNAQQAEMLTHEAEKFDFILSFNSDELNYDLVKERMGDRKSVV